jgi:hypothetical protein
MDLDVGKNLFAIQLVLAGSAGNHDGMYYHLHSLFPHHNLAYLRL